MARNALQKLSACIGTCILLAGCPAEDEQPPPNNMPPPGAIPPPPPPDVNVLEGPSKGGPIAANDAGDTLAVANKSSDDVTLFDLSDLSVRARVSVGDEPSSLCWGADGTTLYVVNRADGSLQRIREANTANPTADAAIAVGAEPGNCATSPTGGRIFVSNWVDGTMSVVAADTMTIARTVDLGGAPYAVCVTNDLDEEDADETIYVTDFFARPIAGRKEATDTGSNARIFSIPISNYQPSEITIEPFDDAGIEATPDTGAYPNQLYGCAINAGRLYVTNVGASPQPFNNTTDFRQNIQGLVHVINLADGTVDETRSVNLNVLVDEQQAPKRFVSVPVDIAFAKNTDIGYVASILSNSLFRVDWTGGAPTGGSSTANFLATGASPIGVAIVGTNAYTYNEVDRTITQIDLAQQTTTQSGIESAPGPANDVERSIQRGQKFFNTGQARWSANGWVGCVGCHPFGLTDNVTWTFPAGPRQTVDLSGTFDESGNTQRILNWTAIFDEVHDFELNTRGVANGTGAIVNDPGLNDNGSPNAGARIDFVGPGGVGNPANGFNVGSTRAVAATGAVPEDWDDIENYIKTIRAPKASLRPEGDAAAGRVVFEEGRCHYCHGGVLWTLSERYYEPLLDQDPRGFTLASQGINDTGDVRADQVSFTNTASTAVVANDGNGPPARHTCVVRKVGTFDADGPAGRGADEIRQNGNAAQGVDGFNVPSLLGVSMGAPYLHNGAAASLEELLDPQGAFVDHLRSGNQVFAPSQDELTNLIKFLRSIDDSTPTIEVPVGQKFCPNGLQ